MNVDLQKFLDYLKCERNYSVKTLIAYENDIATFLEFLEEEGYVYSDITYDVIRGWIINLSEKGLENRTINRKISSLRTFYRFLQQIKRITVDPLQLHRSLRMKKKLQLPFSRKEIADVRQFLEQGDDFDSLRDLIIVELLYGLGLRRAELVGLKIVDFDFYLHQVKVVGKGDKMRFIPLVDELEKIVKKYLLSRKLVLRDIGDHGVLLVNSKGNKIDEMFVYRVINRYFSNATTKEKKSPHMLRHSFATHLIENGADINSVKELMGHESLSTTQMYTQVNLEEMKKVYLSAHPRIKKSKN